MQEDGHSGPREGGWDQEVPTAPPPHSGFSGVCRKSKNQTHRITVVKIQEITLWITYSFFVSLSY